MPRILVIDDSAFMRQYMRGFLEEAGFEVDDFLPESALEVLDRVIAFAPDLVLSDFNMPALDGQIVARTLRRSNPALPVLVVTASRDPAREAVLGTMGVRRILHKPVKGEELVRVVREVLG